ncbi:MAG: hypothetical protein VYD70_04690 [Planctomycetota bacterium]|nr:hypothetical protein [Planctomycetota bacterium]MAW77713.1 hypothetical protein [Planctomycetota bacterium]MEE2883003.1 hypothetical protein [Planctomycetota bacterium]
MPFNENIQNSIVNLVEAFEELQSHLEEKHFGKVIDENTNFEELPIESRENLDKDFTQVVFDVFEGLEDQKKVDIRDIEAVSTILLDAIDEVAPELFEEVSDEEADQKVTD